MLHVELQQQSTPLFDALGASRTLMAMEIFNALCIAFVLSMTIANVYRWTHQGFSYQRSFIHTVVLACIVISIMIMAIGNNMARGLGILGAMAFVRFRTPIRDPRDIIFIFASLAVGVFTLLAGVAALALADHDGGGNGLTAIGLGLGLLFLVRGVVGYTPWWAARTPEPNFRLNDSRVYSPVCLFLGAGFVALAILRLL